MVFTSWPPVFLPRKYVSRLPGRAMGSHVGLGMNRLTAPDTNRRFLPPTLAHCMQRFCMSFGT